VANQLTLAETLQNQTRLANERYAGLCHQLPGSARYGGPASDRRTGASSSATGCSEHTRATLPGARRRVAIN
jgi:hypothetical protein